MPLLHVHLLNNILQQFTANLFTVQKISVTIHIIQQHVHAHVGQLLHHCPLFNQVTTRDLWLMSLLAVMVSRIVEHYSQSVHAVW